MSVVRRHILVLATALAVFAVGATCTPAGCLLSGVFAHPTGSAQTCCFGGHVGAAAPGDHSKRAPSRPCPVCQSPLNGTDSIVKSATPAPHVVFAAPFVTLSSLAYVPAPTLHPFGLRAERPPAFTPPTLFGLHCALLI